MTLPEHITRRFEKFFADYRKELAHTRKSGSETAVHNLRVASRRILETLRVFQGAIDAGAARPIRRSLKRWMRTSGAIRDLDIAIQLARKCRRGDAVEIASRWKRKRSVRWQRVMPEVLEAAVWKGATRPESLAPESAAPGQSIIWDYSLSAAQNASLALPLLLERYILHGNAVFQSGTCEDGLDDMAYHGFRLRTKRFRYTVESFEGFYPTEPFRELLGRLKHFQQVLGFLHDCEVASELFKSTQGKIGRESLPGGVAASSTETIPTSEFSQFLQTRAAELRRQWHQSWQEFANSDSQRSVCTFLHEFASDPHSVPERRKARQELLEAPDAEARKVS
jgi:CHAD domain-containing protein